MSKKNHRNRKPSAAPAAPKPDMAPAASAAAEQNTPPAPAVHVSKAAPEASISLPALTPREIGLFAVLIAVFFLVQCLSSASTIKAVAMVVTIAAVVGMFVRFPVLHKRLTIPLAALCLWVLMNGISTLYAVSGKFALAEFLKMLVAFSLCMIFIAFARGKGTEIGRGIAGILECTTALAGLFSIDLLSTRLLSTPFLGFLGLFSQDYANLIPVETGIRMNSIFTNPNTFAGCVGIGVLLSLGLAVTEQRKGMRRFHLVCLFANAMSFVLAFSMGASGVIMVAFLVYLILERRERRASLLLLMVETLILTVAAAMLVSITSLDEWSGFQPIPLLCLIAGAVLLCVVDEFVGARLAAKLREHGKAVLLLIVVVLALLAGFILLAFNLTGSATLAAGDGLRRSAYPEPGAYTLDVTADTPLTVMIESQNRQDTMMHTSTVLYNGDADGAAFTVPEDSLVVYFNFTAPQGGTIEAVTYQGDAGSGALKLGYKLLPGFMANRLQGLFANQNAIQRTVFFEDGIKLFLRSPVIGLGMGAFENGIVSVQSFYYETKYAHNHYIQALAETGVIGLILFVGVLATAAVAVWKERRKGENGHPLAPALGAALLFMAGHAATEVVFSSYPYLPLAFGVFALISLCCGESMSLLPSRDTVRGWIVVGLAALMVAFAVLLGLNMQARRMVDQSPTFDTLEDAIAIDRFEWTDYMLSYVYSAESLDESNLDIIHQADGYAARLSEVDSNTIPLYLAEYYFQMDRPADAIRMLEKYADYVAANPDTWHSVFQMLRQYQQDTPEYRAGVLEIYQMLQDWNAENMGTITLTEDEMAFVEWAQS